MKSMVKCLVCGAVFEAGAEICPVCGAGPDQFVPAPPAADGTPESSSPAPFRRDTDETFLVLGGGTAGLSAAEAIRERNATCSIVLVTDEAVPPYRRPMLTKVLGGAPGDLSIHNAAWYEARNILLLTGRQVTALDPSAHEIALDGGARLRYGKCVYALGAACFIPPMPGVDLPGVVAIRSIADVEKVSALLSGGAKRAVVIGGGVLGLEAAWGLRRAGCAVTVLERSGRLMARQLDVEAAGMLTAICEAQGVSILSGVESEAIVGDAHVTGVRLKDGRTIEADLVIVSSGVRANAAIAQAAGADTGRAVRVNATMETNLPDVYACGDCAEFDGVNAALWPVATEMGRVAGANAAGDALRYQPVSQAVTFMGMGTRLYADGDVGTDPAKAYTAETARDDAKATLDKRYYADGRLCGVILLGDIGKARAYGKELR